MKRFLLLASACVLSASPAFAQDEGNVIRIIHDDGRVDVIDLRQPAPQPTPQSAPNPVPQSAPAPAQAAPAADPVAVKVAPKPAPEAVPDARVMPKKAVAKKAIAKPQPEKPAVRKVPVQPKETPVVPVRKPVRQTIPQGARITKDRALYIALEAAPPASGMQVVESIYKDKPVFLVGFKTDQGMYEVLVDVASGQILGSGIAEKDSLTHLPGHLPPR